MDQDPEGRPDRKEWHQRPLVQVVVGIGLFAWGLILGAGIANTDTSQDHAPVDTVSASRPTATPNPTGEDACTLPETMEYRSSVGDLASTMSRALGKLERLFGRASRNPNLIYDEDWLVDVAAVLVVMKLFHDEVSALDAPRVLRTQHMHLANAANDYNRSADTIARGLDAENPDTLMQGYALLEDAAASLEQANAAFERACG